CFRVRRRLAIMRDPRPRRNSMSTALRIERPYDSAEAFLEGDAWTVGRSDMLLVDASGIAPGTALSFEIALETGAVVVRGEARALEQGGAADGRPGGLKVRFRQLDADSKAMLRRALEVQKRQRSAEPDRASQPDATGDRFSMADTPLERVSQPEV